MRAFLPLTDVIFLLFYSSTLTLGILKKRYQAHNKCDSLSPEVKTFMKQVVQEELMKMQVPVFAFPYR